ncbi:MAG: hypothetical protein H7Y86_08625 [Rhizobacter sp.]|nr:hypothetical protein [Ferruginibacter sp.]
MKTFSRSCFCWVLCYSVVAGARAQVGINSDGTPPHPSAMLEIKSTTKGLLIPQVSLIDGFNSFPLTGPAVSTMVYNINENINNGKGAGYYFWNGSQWKKMIVDGEGNVPKGAIIYKETDLPMPGYSLKGRIISPNVQEMLGVGAGSWSNIPATGIAAKEHSCVWTGSEMLIWSGKGSSTTFSNFGSKYNPVANSWTNISLVSAPVGRYGHSTVWDDVAKRMIVWGGVTAISGSSAPSVLATAGGIYNNSGNSWIATNTTGAPTARYYHSAVWTGSKMLVWGGRDLAGYYNNGGSFDPSTNSWSALPASPLSARSNHTAIWTGSKMIIWGGENGGTALNSGAMYDPVSNTWSIMSALNAPAGLYNSKAVWTGTEMILVGGNLTSFTDGRIYQYNPAANVWDPAFNRLPGNEVPWNGSISNHTVVWTGTEVIIYGGQNFLQDGTDMCYRFDPATDAISYYANSPYLRTDHSAVWTGAQLLVFGGHTNPATSFLSDGYKLDPTSGTSNVLLYPFDRIMYLFIKD